MKLALNEDALAVTLEGWERLWAMRRRLIIPRGKIVHAEWHGEPFEIHAGLRLAGTAFPGVLAAGTFYGQGMKQFLYVRRPQVGAARRPRMSSSSISTICSITASCSVARKRPRCG
jgi:hypothetical protein